MNTEKRLWEDIDRELYCRIFKNKVDLHIRLNCYDELYTELPLIIKFNIKNMLIDEIRDHCD